MKALKLIGSLMIVFVLLLSSIGYVSAGGPSGSFTSVFSCQNLSASSDAHVTFDFYNSSDGSVAFSYSDTITANLSKSYQVASISGVPSGFNGSVVASSDQALACDITTMSTGTGTSGNPFRVATAGAFASGDSAPKLYAPQVERHFWGWNSFISLQNTGTVSAAVTLSYIDRFGVSVPTATEHATILPGATNTFYQNDNTNLGEGFLGAVVASADDTTTPLAMIITFYNAATDSGTAQYQSYSGFAVGAEKVFVPRVLRNYYGFNTGITVQNVGTSATGFTITYNFPTLAPMVYTSPVDALDPGEALAFYLPNVTEIAAVDGLTSSLRHGGAVIQADSGGSIVANYNVDNRNIILIGDPAVPVERIAQGTTVNAMIDGSQTRRIYFLRNQRRVSNFTGGLEVFNTTAIAGTCDIVYEGAPAANETGVTLPASGSIARYFNNVLNLPDGFDSGITFTCSQPVLGINNDSINPYTGLVGDSYSETNGHNVVYP